MIRQGVRIVGPDGTLTQAGYEMLKTIEAGQTAQAARLTAAAGVPDAAGGAVVDAEARAEMVALKAALG